MERSFTHTQRWRCTFYQCRVAFKLALADGCIIIFVQNKAGKPLALYGGYSFFLEASHTATRNWACTRRGRNVRCKARLITATDGSIFRANPVHVHPPSNYVIRDVIILRNPSGKSVALLATT
ncbi:FLYWCH zinc finger domain-containing protein [Phthorimaea operculella]|nr:FLYWCH zinc finger domain-containing protein [Phthorimaea operculella]